MGCMCMHMVPSPGAAARIMTYASVRIRSYRIVSDHIMTCASVRITIISCHITMFSDLAPYQMRIRRYRHVSEWGLVSVR